MPALKLPLSPQGAAIDLLVSLTATDVRQLWRAQMPVPQPVALRGLIDTGASHTSIDSRAFLSLGLQSVGIIFTSTASTGAKPQICEQYKLSLTVLHPSGDPRLHYIADPVTVTHADLLPYNEPVLIGCDLLNRWVFTYDGPAGEFTLAY
jgi:hypothetical protein